MTSMHRWQVAESDRKAGRLDAARTAYQDLVADAALSAYAHVRLSELALADGDLQLASRHAVSVELAGIREPSLLALMLRQLLRLGESHAARQAASRLSGLPSAPAGLLADAAKQLSDNMEPTIALALLARARAAGLPESAGEAYLQGLNQTYLGELSAARSALERACSIDPGFVPAYWSLAKLRIADGRPARIDALQRLLASIPGDHPDAPLAGYCLFHELDAEDDTDRAWTALANAMAARRRQVRYSDAEDAQLFARMHAALDGGMQASHAAAMRDAADAPGPIMLVGLPRSGTTVIEQSLCRDYQVASAGELRDFVQQMRWVANLPGPPHPDVDLLAALGAAELPAVGVRYLAHTAWRADGMPRYIDKWPENYLVLAHALAAVPGLRAIWVRRDPMDTCWSNLKEWFGASYYYSYDMAEVAGRYARFAAWQRRLREAFGAKIVEVAYERFVAAPSSEIDRIAGVIGLEARTGVPSRPGVVATASAVQVRAGISDRSIGAWRRYARRLGPLRQALADAGIDAGDAT